MDAVRKRHYTEITSMQTTLVFDDQPNVRAFAVYLREQCQERQISLHQLAIRCGLNEIYFYQALNKNKDNPPPWVLRRVSQHLDIQYVEILLAAGYIEEEDIRQWTAHVHTPGAAPVHPPSAHS